MIKTEHTPGPWKVNKYGGIGAGKHGTEPCIISSDGWADPMSGDEKLIAAAPDLLEALKTILAHVEDRDVNRLGTMQCTLCYSHRSIGHAAIAKAEGR